MADRHISFKFRRKSPNATKCTLYPRTTDRDVMIRKQSAFLDSAILDYDKHISDKSKHLHPVTTTGSSTVLMATIPDLTLNDETIITLRLHVDLSRNPKLNLNEYGEFPILTSDLTVMSSCPKKDTYVLVIWSDSNKAWIALSYSNKPEYLIVTKTFLNETTTFQVPEFNSNFDELISINFNQTILRLNLDYSLTDINTIVLLKGMVVKPRESLSLTIVKNAKINLNVDSNYDPNEDWSTKITSTMISSWNNAVLSVADATTKSINAETNATEALNTINSMKASADTAVNTANGAKTTADNALSTANTAKDIADNALSNSSTALSSCENAVTLANSSKLAAEQAAGDANSAKLTVENVVGTLPTNISNGDNVGSLRTSGTKNGYGQGKYSFSSGNLTIASGYSSISEGSYCISAGHSSHAEGLSTVVSGNFGGHSEGNGCLSITDQSILQVASIDKVAKTITVNIGYFTSDLDTFNKMAIGNKIYVRNSGTVGISIEEYTIAAINVDTHTITVSEDMVGIKVFDFLICFSAKNTSINANSHSEGKLCLSTGECAHSEGYGAQANGAFSHAQGKTTLASGESSHAEGNATIADGDYSHAEGSLTKASGNGSHAEGYRSIATGFCSHAEGSTSKASGAYSHAEGFTSNASGFYSHAEGGSSIANGTSSHSEGSVTIADGDYSHTEGYCTTGETYGVHVQGRYNIANVGSANTYSSTLNALVIGNGTSSSAKSNCFRVDYSGNVYGLAAFNSTGADYAEFFEWDDGNPNNEDRIGHFVSLTSSGKIKIASIGEDIIGAVSGNYSLIGDSYGDIWQGMYLRDVFGRYLYEDVEVEIVDTDLLDDHTDLSDNPPTKTVIEHRLKINPEYNPDNVYIPRKDRKEWAAVGMFGKIVVIDDGSCIVGSRCDCNDLGIATSGTSFRVIGRIDNNHIKILSNFL